MSQLKLGITGGIASGKSVASHFFRTCGVPVYDCDSRARILMESDPKLQADLQELLGPAFFDGQGALDRPRLAAALFGDQELLEQVNGLVHPRVKDDFVCWAARHNTAPVVAMESAILFESGFGSAVDKVLLVTSPREVRIARAMQRDGATRGEVEQRMARQMDDAEKMNRSHFVVINDGFTPLLPQLVDVIASLKLIIF